METDLGGRAVLVTGGAGGIGQEICRAFAAEGARVAVHYRTSGDAAGALAREIGGIALGADLTDEDETATLVPAVVDAFGALDVCVANAGWWPPDPVPIWDLSLERFEAVVRANLGSAFLTTRAFLRHAAATGSGSLVLVGSTAGIYGEPGHSDYAAAKGGITTGLLLSAKNEAARIGPGVRVNAVCPGWTMTPQRASEGMEAELLASATATMALKKLGTPADVAAQVVVLSSPRLSGHVTGQVVVVAGGLEGRVIDGPAQ